MKHLVSINRLGLLYAGLVVLTAVSMTGTASALADNAPHIANGTSEAAKSTAATSSSGSSSSGSSTSDATRVKAIISAGDREIGRRLTSLNTLSGKIAGTTKLSSSDQAYLTNEVTTEIGGLTTLKAQLDADTTLASAKTDAQSIINDYRVYALIVPKVQLIRVADDQQVVEGKLTDLATKLQTRINTAKAAGKSVTELQTKLTDMTTQTSNAQAISSAIESKVLTLQPTDYDSDHTILSGDSNQLKTAHNDTQTAYNDAKVIIGDLKNL